MVIKPIGAQPWAILQVLVKPTPSARAGAFNPNRALPNQLQMTDLFQSIPGAGDLPSDLWARLSFGRIDITGSQVFGPFDAIRQDGAPADTDDWDKMIDDESANKLDRGQKVLSGIRGAIKAGIVLTPFWGVIVVPDYQIDSFGGYGQVKVGGLVKDMGQALLDYNDFSTGRLMHEMGHGFGFDHARGDFNSDPGGDYGDPSDIMSYARCVKYRGTNGVTGPGFSAASLWARGWLPDDVQLISSTAGFADTTYALSSLYASKPLPPGMSRALVIDVDRAGRYVDRELYFVELRDNKGVDRGFPRPAVFVHRLRRISGQWEGSPWLVGPNQSSPPNENSGLLPSGAGWMDKEAGFGVGVVSIDSVAGTAVVQIVSARSTISIAESMETISEEVTGFDVDRWGGLALATSDMCRQSHEDEYEVLARSQKLTLQAIPGGGLAPTHAVTWRVQGIPVTASGPVSFPLTYENPARDITLDVVLNGQTLVLQNRPGDGLIKFYVEVNPQPSVVGVGASSTNLQFEGSGRRYYDSEHASNVAVCAQETADALRGRIGDRAHWRPANKWTPVQDVGEEHIFDFLRERVNWLGDHQ